MKPSLQHMRNVTVAGVAIAALTLAGCSNSEKDSANSKVDTAVVASTSAAAEKTEGAKADETKADATKAKDAVSIEDGFVKAMEAGKGMTAIFGTLHNNSDAEVNVVGFTTSLGEAKYELHEVVDGVMQEKPEGFKIPAGGTHLLAPGGDHMMIMGYNEAIEPGDEVEVTLKLADGSTVEVGKVPARFIASGEENYGADGNIQGDSGIDESKQGAHQGHGENMEHKH